MGTKIVLHEIRVPSNTLRDVRFAASAAAAELVLQYSADGNDEAERIAFSKTRCFRHREEVHCTGWHVADAYDTLVEVKDSAWAREIRSDTSSGWEDEWILTHYLIYLDGYGAYEFLAADWNVSFGTP